ncbi:MAG: DNA polymerase III subunit beta [Patescibacteria group bacterium]|nr:DNA polymerase III subunit beta [Patescibacteria group bacterium]MBU1421310.1 DNA polymerase III subunit beta [Patescibacteria group bacterium]MBU2474832.1 DNA polymerase III subunit beta [Patescibacteria group bacterium]
MNFSTLQENLKKGLFAIGHVAGKNTNLPILNNVMIEAKNNEIKLLTTNLDVGITNKIRGKINKEGTFTVNSKILTDYINLLPNKKIDIINEKNNLIIKCENYQTKIIGQSADDFPLIPNVETDNCYSVKADDLKSALSKTIFAVSRSELRLEISGIFLNFNNKKATIVGTDSYRLVEVEFDINANLDNNKSIIIPIETASELIRIISGAPGRAESMDNNKSVEIYITDNQVLFKTNETELVSRLIEGQYPDYKQIIPINIKTNIIINKNDLIRAVKTCSLFSKKEINDITFDFLNNKNQVIISSVSGQVGENIVELDVEINGGDGEESKIIINHRYLLDGLSSIEDDRIKIEIVNNNTPCVLRPEKEKNYLYIIKPIVL